MLQPSAKGTMSAIFVSGPREILVLTMRASRENLFPIELILLRLYFALYYNIIILRNDAAH